MDYKSKKDLGIIDNDTVAISKIKGISIHNFRNIKNQEFKLSDNITLVSGRNGTMKSTVMGLVAHPYNTLSTDVFGKNLKTQLSQVFKLSENTDIEKYKYNLNLEIIHDDNKQLLSEPVKVYPGKKSGKYDRHRVVVSGSQRGDGNFTLPSTYINLKRLFPLVETDVSNNNSVSYSKDEKNFISRFFEKVLLKESFSEFETFDASTTGTVLKQSIGPKNANYDIDSISSGEDNLGTIVNILVSYMRLYDEKINRGQNKRLTGLISIDEFEASLHPISQLNLFNFLLEWSQKYNVQLIINTHSLFLIDEVLKMTPEIKKNKIAVNFITSAFSENLEIWHNPSYKMAKRELTLADDEEKISFTQVKILCEDDVAVALIKSIIGQKLAKRCKFQANLSPSKDGNSWPFLEKLATEATALLQDSMSMIIFDGDVNEQKLKNKNFDKILKIPTINDSNFAFEKELANYILKKKTDDNFFQLVGKTKEQFKQSFVRNGISLAEPEKSDMKCYKKWYDSLDGHAIRKYRTQLIKENKAIFDDFKLEFLKKMNMIFKENGFPMIEEI
ncbi:AAA family ATPase [Streptococcus caprae]|uniref:AAA family ATPase n=1 Tax=Streptococcus caprae TaxID=1640501 RepID=A0ABV8CT56_9STRE